MLGQLEHLFLDGGEVVGTDSTAFAEVDIVVEAVFDGGADGQLHAGVEGFKGLGHEVGRGVPVGLLAASIVPGEDFEGGVGGEGTVQVADFAVDLHGQGVAGEAFADAGGEVVAGGAGLDLADGAIGEGDIEHN